MGTLDWILIAILIAIGVFEAFLLATRKRTITQKWQDLNTPRWLNLVICIGLVVIQYYLYTKWNVHVHPFIVAFYNIIFGHVFGRF